MFFHPSCTTASSTRERPVSRRARGFYLLAAGLAGSLLVATPSNAQDRLSPAGSWIGMIEVPPAALQLDITLHQDEGEWSGVFSVPAEGSAEQPMESVEVTEDSLFFAMASGQSFSGRIVGDSISGFLEAPGGQLATLLVRSGTPAADMLQEELRELLEVFRPEPLEEVQLGPAFSHVDAEALSHLVERARESNSHSLVILKDGELVGEWHAGGTSRPLEAMSVTKVALNLAVGRLLHLGLLSSVDTPVHVFYPEWKEGERSAITVRHLLNHTSGIASPMPTQPIYASQDFVQFALEAELVSEPGSEFVYNNNAANLLAGLIEKVAGKRLDDFLRDDLFSRLGIDEFHWSLDPAGNPHGMSGLQVHAEDLATLGHLALERGHWKGEQLIAPDWFDESFRAGSSHNERMGLIWWLILDENQVVGVEHSGYLGQWLVVYPEEGVVGVRTIRSFPSYDAERDAFLDFVRELRKIVGP